MTGSTVFVDVVPPDKVDERVEEGDVITFSTDVGETTTTHRVIEKRVNSQSNTFVLMTKGDANEERDNEPVTKEEVIGVVQFSIPFLGYGVAFANSKAGIVVFILVPSALLIVDEVYRLYQASESEGGKDVQNG